MVYQTNGTQKSRKRVNESEFSVIGVSKKTFSLANVSNILNFDSSTDGAHFIL